MTDRPNILLIMTDEERYPPPYEGEDLHRFRTNQLPARTELQARGLTLVDTLPQGVTYQSASQPPSSIYGQTLTWNLGDTPAGGYALTINVQVKTSGLDHGEVLAFVKDCVSWGAGPRATQYLILGAKAWALLSGKYAVTCNDIRSVAPSLLRHRIFTNFNADAENLTPDKLITRLLQSVPEPSEKDYG